MQFVANGPEIPDSLLQAHEEGRVVFFCGAGISYPAGLPGYQGLVDKTYNLLGTAPTKIEQDVYSREKYDAVLDLLERRFPGQRIAVRSAVAKILRPNLRRKGATETHASLLTLARDRNGILQLVTTNFDCIFERAAKRINQTFTTYTAPTLPIPKKSRWDGLVYLHGLLPRKEDERALNRLVLTSGDFGLAYLSERWAARFVSELFRNYVICFVGYSINDQVLRYMMDALAADRLLGEKIPQAYYALSDCEPGQESDKKIEWEAKGVAPIFYEVHPKIRDHSLLHNTLKVWAETYRDGVLGKERIVVSYALANPSASTQQDDFVGRMLWALSDASGLPAKRFANLNPVPALTWLDAFSEDRYQHSDLARFGVSPSTDVKAQYPFSLLRRPAPYAVTPLMTLAYGGAAYSQWDDVMRHMARWLVRHLNDPALVIWLAERGGQLHDNFSYLIESELNRFARLRKEGKATELEDIRSTAPNAIPEPPMQTLWRLLLTNRVKSQSQDWAFYRWKERFARDGLTPTVRLELSEALAPKVVLNKPFRWGGGSKSDGAPLSVRQLVDWELVLTTDNASHVVETLAGKDWHEALPVLLDDFQHLLRDALDLRRELGGADDHDDHSHWELPSISPHWQNRRFHDWVILIELTRDAWLATMESDRGKAIRIAQHWFNAPYSTFKRLALFAASQNNCITPDQWGNWLISGDSWWLWSQETQREAMRLLVLQGANLSSDKRTELEATIIAGPPRIMYQANIDPKDWDSIVDRSVWLRLAKLREGSGKLGDAAAQRFDYLSIANPDRELDSHERDEFSHWMSGTGDPDYEENHDIDIAPRKRRDLVKWLKQPLPTQRPFYEDTWHETCRTRFFHSFLALCDLSKQGFWPVERWRVALQTWSEKDKVVLSWQFVAPLIRIAPDEILKDIVHVVAWWLNGVSKSKVSTDRHTVIFLELCHRVLILPYQKSVDTDQPVQSAINHPIGLITEALLNLWLSRKPNDNDGLPDDIKPFFVQLCDTSIEYYYHGRVLLASQLIALFRVDLKWTEEYLLPLFNWSTNPTEARAVWEGFLWSPRLYRRLLSTFKIQFLETANHYEELREHKHQFAMFLTYAALEQVDDYASQDFQKAIEVLPREGLQDVAQALTQALEGTGEQREDYWKNRIQPFWHNVWPKSLHLVSDGIVESLARLSIAARDEFPNALSTVLGWLRPIENSYFILHVLHESKLASRFPADVLCLLNAVLDDRLWVSEELKQCLVEIEKAAPALKHDLRYQKLLQYSRQRGN